MLLLKFLRELLVLLRKRYNTRLLLGSLATPERVESRLSLQRVILGVRGVFGLRQLVLDYDRILGVPFVSRRWPSLSQAPWFMILSLVWHDHISELLLRHPNHLQTPVTLPKRHTVTVLEFPSNVVHPLIPIGKRDIAETASRSSWTLGLY